MPRPKQVVRGIKMTQAKKGNKKARFPISVEVLGKLRDAWIVTTKWDNKMLWVAASLCFFEFFHSGELTVPSEAGYDPDTHLSRGDITVDSLQDPQILRIHLQSSKTDPFQVGVDVFVGCTDYRQCPVAALLH